MMIMTTRWQKEKCEKYKQIPFGTEVLVSTSIVCNPNLFYIISILNDDLSLSRLEVFPVYVRFLAFTKVNPTSTQTTYFDFLVVVD